MCSSSDAVERQVLPSSVKPTHYNLTLLPSIEQLVYSGSVSIALTVTQPTNTITINSKELGINSAAISLLRVLPDGLDTAPDWPISPQTHRLSQKATDISYNEGEETATLTFLHEIPSTAKLVLHLEFDGIHNDKLNGFYRSSYTDEQGVKQTVLSTQFEASDARKAFPCFDEPNLKATFDVTLHVPKGLVGLSNMNVIEERPVVISEKEYTVVKFATTPLMSTYLLAFCIGDFEYAEAVAHPQSPADAKPVLCRTYTLRGQKHLGQFALETSVKVLEFFSSYFDIAYPLPKLDQIAIPELMPGGMENWGLITYKNDSLLFNGRMTSKKEIAEVVGHEIAHQWFGNLVTLDWWSDLWLNEAFASYAGTLVTDHLFPEMNVFDSFSLGYFHGSLKEDSLKNTHPVHVPVRKASDAMENLDMISYGKGASLIRMLEHVLGSESFAKGISHYLKQHAYQNATTSDLWRALSESTGQDIAALMDVWIQEPGLPYLTVTEDLDNENITLQVSQARFLASGDGSFDSDVIWFVPLVVTTGSSSTPSPDILKSKSGAITFPFSPEKDKFWKLNSGTTGFYRVNYSKEQFARISSALCLDINVLGVADKIGLLGDVFAMVQARLCPTTSVLDLLSSLKNEENALVLQEISGQLSDLRNTFFLNSAVMGHVDELAKSIFASKMGEIGYIGDKDEDFTMKKKRAIVLNACVDMKDAQVLADMYSIFQKFIHGGPETAVELDLLKPALRVAMLYSPNINTDFKLVFQQFKETKSHDIRAMCLTVLGSVNSIDILRNLLFVEVFDNQCVSVGDLNWLLFGVFSSPLKDQAFELLWEWFTLNFERLFEMFSGHFLLPLVIGGSMGLPCNIGTYFIKRVEDWTSGVGMDSSKADLINRTLQTQQRNLASSLEVLRDRTAWFERDQSSITAWFEEKDRFVLH